MLTCLQYACSPAARDDAPVIQSPQDLKNANRLVWDDYWNKRDVDVVQAIDSKGHEQPVTWASPRSISPARRALAIKQLQACEGQWQWRSEHVTEADQADKVVEELTLGEDVPWSEIWNACDAMRKKNCYVKMCCKP